MEFLAEHFTAIATALAGASFGGATVGWVFSLSKQVAAAKAEIARTVAENIALRRKLEDFEGKFYDGNRRVATAAAAAEATARLAAEKLTSRDKIPAGTGFGSRPTGRVHELPIRMRARREIPAALKGIDAEKYEQDPGLRKALADAAKVVAGEEIADESRAIEVAVKAIGSDSMPAQLVEEIYATFATLRDRIDAEYLATLVDTAAQPALGESGGAPF